MAATMQVPNESASLFGDYAELRNSGGDIVGYFLSTDAYRKLLYRHANDRVTDQDLESARQQPGGKTTVELLDHLKTI
jgi:hypothetical protein